MNRFVLPAILLMAIAARAASPERGQLDANPTLFTVMAAMDIAGVGSDPDSPTNHPLRAAIRAELAKRNIPSLPDLKKYFALHRQKNDTLELSQYVSWSLAAGGPPDFDVRGRDVDLPPDVTPLLELSSLMALFYKEADLDDLWKRSQPAIEQYLGRYHSGVVDLVFTINAYLRQQTSGFRGRHFQVYVELLGPPNQIQTRSVGNEYTIVLTPSPDPQFNDVRHAYLHYVLDPLATRHQEVVLRKRGLSDHAQRAPALAESYKSDFLLLVTESLIKAVEARLDRKPAAVNEALREGYILTPYFVEALPVYEKQEQAMILYFPDMIKAIELRREDARLQPVEFDRDARVRQARSVTTPAPPPAPALSGVAKMLDDADQLYAARVQDPANLNKAKQIYLTVLQQAAEKPVHAAAYYGLARVAVLQKDPEVAERLFQKVIDSAPEAPIHAWALVYLGRLSDAAADREQAIKHYRAALQIAGISEAARKAAEQGVQQSSKP